MDELAPNGDFPLEPEPSPVNPGEGLGALLPDFPPLLEPKKLPLLPDEALLPDVLPKIPAPLLLAGPAPGFLFIGARMSTYNSKT